MRSYSLQDERDQSDGLHSHVVLLIQCHRYYAVLSKQMKSNVRNEKKR